MNRGFYAWWDGEGACGHEINEGDHIGYSDDDELLCTECFQEAKQEATEDVVDEFVTPGLLEQWASE